MCDIFKKLDIFILGWWYVLLEKVLYKKFMHEFLDLLIWGQKFFDQTIGAKFHLVFICITKDFNYHQITVRFTKLHIQKK